MNFSSGYLTLGRLQGAPVRVHWTLPIGAWVLTGFGLVPGAWVGFALLLLAHEIGHASIVHAYRLRIDSIDIHGLGGACHWSGNPTERQRAVIAWGGVLAQLVVLLTTPLWGARLAQPVSPFAMQLISAFTGTNVLLMAFNLIPVRPLDGAEAWRLFRIGNLFPSRRKVTLRRKARSIQRQLDALAKEGEGARPEMGKVIPFKRPGADRSKSS